MEDDQDLDFGVARAAPALVSLTLFSPFVSPPPRRLSSHFNQPSRPVPAARQLTWVSLQGRIVGAEESSSVGAIGGSLSREESVAWELFSPIHRILIVAVVAVATGELKKSRQIWQLKRSVNLRDQVLSSMQQKLDDMCKQMNTMKDQSENVVDMSFTKNKEYPFAKDTKSNKATLLDCGCRLCNEHHASSNSLMCQILNQRDSVEKACGGDEVFKFKMPLTNGAVQEERRISDLSDWASSVTSAADIQLSTLAIEQDIYNLRRECEEKDATIKEISDVVNASDVSGSKRIAELEDIIRRKNMIIARLKKEMVVLEQQVVHLTRLRRPFFSASSSNIRQLPAMADNLLYDMDSSTSPSSSDSDRPVENQSHGPIHEDHKNLAPREAITVRKIRTVTKAKTPDFLPKPTNNSLKLRSVSPLKENSMNQRPDLTVTLRQRQSVSADGYMKRNRRHTQTSSKDMTPQKRWV